jgi:hypothetical protein
MQYLKEVEKELVSYSDASPRFVQKELSNTRRRVQKYAVLNGSRKRTCLLQQCLSKVHKKGTIKH